MPNDEHDQALFSGFESLTPELVASQRAVKRTRDLVLQGVNPCEACTTETVTLASPLGNAKHPFRWRLIAYSALVTSFLHTGHRVADNDSEHRIAVDNDDVSKMLDRVAELIGMRVSRRVNRRLAKVS